MRSGAKQHSTGFGEEERAWQTLGDHELICEGFVAFDTECSIIAARGNGGQTAFWPLTHNLHRNGILAIRTQLG